MTTTPNQRYAPGKHGPIRIDSKVEAEPEERESFFYIDEREYTILKNPSPALGLEFLALVGERGEVGATAQMFDRMVERGALRKLSACKGITAGEVSAIIEVVGEKLMAAAETASGNS